MGKKKGGFKVTWSPKIVNAANISNRQTATQQDDQEFSSIIDVSNPNVPLPDGLFYREEIVSNEEESALLKDIMSREFIWEGFDHRRRVQRYDFTKKKRLKKNVIHYEQDDSIPAGLFELRARLEGLTGHIAQHVAVEEYSVQKGYRSGEYASNGTVTTFETLVPTCLCSTDDETCSCSCFVAQVPLNADSYQHWNQPRKRHPNCWTLKSTDHWTDIRLQQRSVLIKTDDCLFQWRSRVMAAPSEEWSSQTTAATIKINPPEPETPSPGESTDGKSFLIILKFYSLPEESGSIKDFEGSDDDFGEDPVDDFGYKPSDKDFIPPADEPMPRLQDLLTLVITTSPVRSNPSTELLEAVTETFKMGGDEFAFECPKVIICDGFRLKDEKNNERLHGHKKITQKHNNVKQALRNGVVNNDQAENYRKYKENLKKLCAEAAESGDKKSPFRNAVVVELEERHGYGFALRHALQHCVKTQFVCVLQHDRTFMRPTPMKETVHAMWRHPNIKYIGLTMRSNLMYRDLFLGKYGRMYQQDFDETILRVPELLVESSLYGPGSASAEAIECESDKVQKNIDILVETYRASAQGEIPQKRIHAQNQESGQTEDTEGKHQILLIPTLFWYDNVHICETAHYRDFIFNPTFKMVARGGFVEDKLSPVMKKTVERLGFREGHSRFGCYLLDDASGLFFTGHKDGGSYLTFAAKEEIRAMKMSK